MNEYKPPAVYYKSKSLFIVLLALFFRFVELVAESFAVFGRIIDVIFGFISKVSNKCANWLLGNHHG